MMLNTLQQARDVFFQDVTPLLDQLHWPYHFNSQTMNLKVFDTTVHLRSAERDAIERIESIAYGSGWADEASFYDPESMKVFLSRIRKGSSKVRITSMPDEPDHWLYGLLEKAKFKIYEISLYDNPDKEFVKNYEEILKSFYEGPQLKRYLSGERVSLAGLGLFNVKSESKIPLKYDEDEDLYLIWDFNNEYRAVSVWQEQGKNSNNIESVGCIRSYQMKEDIVYDDATELAKVFQNHKANIYLGGDASENKRSSQTTESIWMTVRRAFKDVYSGDDTSPSVRSIVPTKNPNVKDTIQCCNWAFGQDLVYFDEDEKNVYSSLVAMKADKHGEIDKSVDQKKSGAKSHESDTARYALWHFYKHKYPGGKSTIWAV